MKRFGNLAVMLAALALFVLCFPPQAHAYLDLGTGSLLLQVLLAFLLGAGVAIKIFWKNIRDFVRRLMGKEPLVEETPSEEGAEGPDAAADLTSGSGSEGPGSGSEAA